MEKIDISALVPLDEGTGNRPLRVDLVYARADHPDNIFGTAIYRPRARMWAHADLARVIFRAADICYAEHKYLLELKDCLRTVEAQERMIQTPVVRANPHWIGELLSAPGQSAHPRAMAIDLILVDENGEAADMGTSFDHLSEDPARNPAARAFQDLPPQALDNRRILESCMMRAAGELGVALRPLPSEWWDFRFPPERYNACLPLRDRDLPPWMRMTPSP